MSEKKKESIAYRGIENLCENQWSWEVKRTRVISPPKEGWMNKIKRMLRTVLKFLKR